MLRFANRLSFTAPGVVQLPTLTRTAVRSASTLKSPLASESFLNGTNSVYAEEMYRAYREDPSSVHSSWRAFFGAVDTGSASGEAFAEAPSPDAAGSFSVPSLSSGPSSLSMRAAQLVRAYQVRGHEKAKIDPLGLWDPTKFGAVDDAPELNPTFTEAELDTVVDLGFHEIEGFMSTSGITVRELRNRLQAVYTGSIGYEYMHIGNSKQCNWIREHIETLSDTPFTKEQKLHILDRVAWAEKLETTFGLKFPSAKRFGLEGVDSLIVGTKAMLDRVSELGVKSVVFGMPHRGRLNVLANVMRKPLELMFKEFEETHIDLDSYEKSRKAGDWSYSGDVKYHLGTSTERTYDDGRHLHLSLVANPSHLEAADPIVIGKVRAKQDMLMGSTISDVAPYTSNKIQTGRKIPGPVPEHTKSVLGVLMHGDAAFAGQGVVYETLGLSNLADYQTGGTIHIVANNQVGFTTDPGSARSSLYCTDLGKTWDIPIFHVNADDPEAVVRVFTLAADYRQTWHTDVIVDLVGYRRWGHNEADNPEFTQPVMYSNIRERTTCLTRYKDALVAEGSVTREEAEGVESRVQSILNEAWDNSKTTKLTAEWNSSTSPAWSELMTPREVAHPHPTGVELDTLRQVGSIISTRPDGFKMHKGLKRVMDARAKMISDEAKIDWGTAEALAVGTLCLEGTRVRLSGQDVERGTFSHRHVVLHDHESGERFSFMDQLPGDAAPFTVCNSSLSEFGVLGFEVGYSLEDPKVLNMWEAQFGDFANGAQIIIDQFIAAGEAKWGRQSGITLLLPHGYDGQGPEHSSCRLERFLQMCDDAEDEAPRNLEGTSMRLQETNWQVVNVSTPANYFHLLRRQIHRDFRKPLIVASPKALLRHKDATATFEQMGPDTGFRRVIEDETITDDSSVRRLVLCSGKVYYELNKARIAAGIEDVALVRVEQLAPFPLDRIALVLRKYPEADLVWCQEEPQNMGAWTYVAPRLEVAAKLAGTEGVRARYVGRKPSASPAAGSKKIHEIEQQDVLDQALE